MYHCIVMTSLLTEPMFKGVRHILDIVLYVLRFEGEIKKNKKGLFSENILFTMKRIVSIKLDIYMFYAPNVTKLHIKTHICCNNVFLSY